MLSKQYAQDLIKDLEFLPCPRLSASNGSNNEDDDSWSIFFGKGGITIWFKGGIPHGPGLYVYWGTDGIFISHDDPNPVEAIRKWWNSL